jgi:hypothetical protein
VGEKPSASKPAESVEQLLSLDDEDFVRCAYLSVLGRPADPSGLAGYVRQVRLGADKKDLVVALATSPEAYKLPTNLQGLKELVHASKQKRSSFFLRAIRHLSSEALRPVTMQLQAYEHQLNRLNDSMKARFDNLDAAIERLSRASGLDPALKGQEIEELKQMTAHARAIYYQILDAATENSRVARS